MTRPQPWTATSLTIMGDLVQRLHKAGAVGLSLGAVANDDAEYAGLLVLRDKMMVEYDSENASYRLALLAAPPGPHNALFGLSNEPRESELLQNAGTIWLPYIVPATVTVTTYLEAERLALEYEVVPTHRFHQVSSGFHLAVSELRLGTTLETGSGIEMEITGLQQRRQSMTMWYEANCSDFDKVPDAQKPRNRIPPRSWRATDPTTYFLE